MKMPDHNYAALATGMQWSQSFEFLQQKYRESKPAAQSSLFSFLFSCFLILENQSGKHNCQCQHDWSRSPVWFLPVQQPLFHKVQVEPVRLKEQFPVHS